MYIAAILVYYIIDSRNWRSYRKDNSFAANSDCDWISSVRGLSYRPTHGGFHISDRHT